VTAASPPAPRHDLVVVGAGPAGEKGAAQAAYFGKRVAVVEARARPGGIAVTTAGIPTKALREGAVGLYVLGHRVASGELADDFRFLMERKAEVSELMTKAVERNLVRHGIERIQGRACLLGRAGDGGPHRVAVTRPDGMRVVLEAGAVLLATGARPHHPAGVPMDDPDVHDSESILDIPRAPASLVVLGAGSVGCEYASMFGALGVRVTLVDARAQVLPALDLEMARSLAESLNALGVRIVTGAEVVGVERQEKDAGSALVVRLANGPTLACEQVLVAAGRRPCTSELGLEAAGIEVDAGGWVRVDGRYETTCRGVFAAGDVLGPPGLASESMEQARVAVCHALGVGTKTSADPYRPTYVFSIPEVAWVGLTEEAAKAEGLTYEIGRASFSANAKARISGFPDGLVKLVFRVEDRRLLGAHVVGEQASELIAIPQLVLHTGGTLDRFIDMTFAVPTRSEAFKYAAYDGLMRLARRASRPPAAGGAVP
jgi:NAD(P) transhydrogenase